MRTRPFFPFSAKCEANGYHRVIASYHSLQHHTTHCCTPARTLQSIFRYFTLPIHPSTRTHPIFHHLKHHRLSVLSSPDLVHTPQYRNTSTALLCHNPLVTLANLQSCLAYLRHHTFQRQLHICLHHHDCCLTLSTYCA